MGDAAKRAGSSSEDKQALTRAGYQIENIPGVKEYILWLQNQRALVTTVDETEIVDKLREIYRGAITGDKFKEACDAVKLLGMVIGMFGAGAMGNKVIADKKKLDDGSKPNTDAFKDGDDENETEDRLKKLQAMMKDLNK
jgi:hypothetical protein